MDETLATDAGEWTAGRQPLADEAQESARTTAYWEWLDAARLSFVDTAERVSGASRGGSWAKLDGPQDADYEASHMRHSIGHSWSKYSGFGDIYSLRSADGLPQATVLVSAGSVVHAREHENARLSSDNEADLAAFAASMGWAIKPDPMAFDVLAWDAGAPNTRLAYLHRAEDGTKTFGNVVLQGRVSEDRFVVIEAALRGGKCFDPRDVGLASLAGPVEGSEHELMSFRYVWDDPTIADAEAILAALGTRRDEVAKPSS